ncbi:acyltransferase family protein [Henriciella sp. AS95]|uniref:acyltransferase family protein n=1 Tax=Henriciella sp. AS95 TaxID=3135782 RepID=UPI00317FC1B1
MVLNYRPEIDGLRAIAVLGVVFYHGEFVFHGLDILPGGFLGVDIFFVISGYLISTIILKEAQSTGFSFLRFYKRRARRILPALFLVLFATLPLSWMYMLPEAAKQYAGSALSSLFFGSNFWFWKEDSYTAEASALKPLLHTWTLSVEEQFYLVFPVVLLGVWRFAKHYIDGVIACGLIVSLVAADYASRSAPDANFYLLIFRGWELLAGAMLASWQTSGVQRAQGPFSAAVPPIALAMIVVPMLTFSDDMRHPSYFTAIPVAGTALLIWFCKQGELITDALSTPPMRFFGLTSYSFYLWHFPAIAFLHIYEPAYTQWMMLAAIGVSGALSFCAYYFVEQPLRKQRVTPDKVFYPLITVCFAVLVSIFAAIYFTNGLPSRLGAAANLFTDLRSPPIRQLGATCDPRNPIRVCEAPVPNDGPSQGDIILIGDSHAMALTQAAIDYAHRNNRQLIRISTAGCPYIIGVYSKFNDDVIKPTCGPERWKKIQAYLKQASPSLIIYSANLPFYLNREFYDNGEREPKIRENMVTLSVEPRFERRGLTVADLIPNTIKDMLNMGHSVAVVYPIPEAGYDVPAEVLSALAKVPMDQRLKTFQQMKLDTSYSTYRMYRRDAKAALDKVPNSARIMRVFPNRLFCDQETDRCSVTQDDKLLYFDESHVSVFGAELIMDEIDRTVKGRFP